MARCKNCGKEVGCGCKLKNGLCSACRVNPTTTSTQSSPIIKKITFKRK